MRELKNLAAWLGVKSIFVKDESSRFNLQSFKALGGSFAIASYLAKKCACPLDFDKLTYESVQEKVGNITFATTTDGNHDALLAALTSRDDAAICQIVEDTYPIDLGIVMEQFSDEEILYLCGQLKDEKVAEILEHAEENLQIRLMRILDNNRIISLLHFMSKDNIVDILGDMPVNSRKEIVKLMKFGERKIIQDLLGYAEDTAGGIMTTEYISVKQDLTVSQALQKIKEIGPKTEEINTIFVLNNVKQLVGTVALRDMLLAQDTTKLSEIMQDNVIAVEPEADQEEVAMPLEHISSIVSKAK